LKYSACLYYRYNAIRRQKSINSTARICMAGFVNDEERGRDNEDPKEKNQKTLQKPKWRAHSGYQCRDACNALELLEAKGG